MHATRELAASCSANVSGANGLNRSKEAREARREIKKGIRIYIFTERLRTAEVLSTVNTAKRSKIRERKRATS